jgi:hypothetical protein
MLPQGMLPQLGHVTTARACCSKFVLRWHLSSIHTFHRAKLLAGPMHTHLPLYMLLYHAMGVLLWGCFHFTGIMGLLWGCFRCYDIMPWGVLLSGILYGPLLPHVHAGMLSSGCFGKPGVERHVSARIISPLTTAHAMPSVLAFFLSRVSAIRKDNARLTKKIQGVASLPKGKFEWIYILFRAFLVTVCEVHSLVTVCVCVCRGSWLGGGWIWGGDCTGTAQRTRELEEGTVRIQLFHPHLACGDWEV